MAFRRLSYEGAVNVARKIFEWNLDGGRVYPDMNIGGLCGLMASSRHPGILQIVGGAVASLRDFGLLSPAKVGNWEVVSHLAKGWHAGPKLGSEKLYFVSERDASEFAKLNGLDAEKQGDYVVPTSLGIPAWREIFVKLTVPLDDADKAKILAELARRRIMAKDGYCDPSKVYNLWVDYNGDMCRESFGCLEEGRFVRYFFAGEEHAQDFCRALKDLLPCQFRPERERR